MPRFVAAVFGLIFAIAAFPACALTTYCVDTVGELDDALATTQDDDVRINLVQGSYDLRATRIGVSFDIEAALSIVGGYSAGCASRSRDATLTQLYADTDSYLAIGNGGEIVLTYLTIRDFSGLRLNPVDGGSNFRADHDLTLDHVRFRHGGEVIVYATNAYLKQVAVTNSFAGCAFTAQPGALDYVQVENSLFANNAGNGFCIHNASNIPESWGDAAIYNTIFWNNGDKDINTISAESNSDLVLRDNIYHSTSIVPPLEDAAVGTIDADPQVVDAPGGDFHIGNASPARNSGTLSIPGSLPTTDIEGLPRVVGSGVDRGPYENQSAGALFLYTVTNTNDAGTGSLRQALLDAEGNAGLNGIVFNIPGACPRVIDVPDKDNPLPVITQSLVIDGLSQPGSSGNNAETTFNATLCVLLKAGTDVAKGLVVDDAAPTSASVSIKGLGFTGFTTAAIDLRGSSGHYLGGNRFSGSMGANTLEAGDYAIRVSRTQAPAVSGVQIGGDDPNQRNLIGSAGYGIVLVGDQVRSTLVVNNFIGVAANGIGANANTIGIVDLGAIDSTIRDNWIGGNASDGVFLNGSDAYVTGNHIGVAPVAGPLGNGGWGVRLNLTGGGNANNVVGSGVAYYFGLPTPVGAGNVIANNGAGGIRASGGSGHRFSRNLVYDNGQPDIDIAADGFTFNDNDAAAGADALSNRGQNYPLITGLQGGDHLKGTIHATLSSRNGTYRVEVFTSSACYHTGLSGGAARVYHGATLVTISNGVAGQNGSKEFDYVLEAKVGAKPLDDRGIVMLAIDADGNTSELSLCNTYQYSDVIFADDFE
jgi:hypothetical protein